MSNSSWMLATGPSRLSGFAALCASLGLHAVVLGGIVGGLLVHPVETPSGAGAWAGRTFEISNLSEVLPGARAEDGSAAAERPGDGAAAPATKIPEAADQAADSPGAATEPPPASAASDAEHAERASSAKGRMKASSDDAMKRSASPGAKHVAHAAPPGQPNSAGSNGAGTPSTGAAADGSAPSTAGGVYGAEGAAARRGNLPDAFTRALPAAARAQATWRTLPLGPAGRVVVVVRLDESGAVEEVTPLGAVPKHLEHLLRTTRLLLQAGRFAPAPEGAAGEYRLGLRAELDQVAASVDENALPEQVRHLASRYPTRKEPGEATLTYNSGRRVRFDVFLDPERRTDW